MPIVEESITIDRPREEVFAFAVDPENVAVYSSNLTEFEKTSEGPVGRGTTYRGVARVAGKSLAWTSEVVQFEEGRRSVTQSVKSPMAWQIDTVYEDAGSGTLVKWRQETDSFGGFFGKLSDPLVTRMYAKDVRANLEKLKDLLEEAD